MFCKLLQQALPELLIQVWATPADIGHQCNLSPTDHHKTKQRVGAEGLEPPTSSV